MTGCWSRRRPGVPGRLPFWKGDQLGRPLELGRALGAFLRELGSLAPDDARLRLLSAGLDALGGGQPDRLSRRAAPRLRPHPGRPDDRGRALPRRAGRLAGGHPLPLRRPGARPLGAGARRPPAERYGMDAQVMHADDGIVLRLPDADLMGLDLLDQDPAHLDSTYDSEQAPVGAGGHGLRQGRDRADRHRPGRRLGAVRLPFPRVRRARPAAAAAQPGQAHPAVAAAPAGGSTAPGGERVRVVPDRPRGGPGVPSGRLRRPRPDRADGRPRGAQGASGRGHHARAVPVRPLAPVRLCRAVPLRGRLAARRAAGRRAVPGLPSAGRAARPGRAARAAGRRGAGRAGAGAAVAHRGPPHQGRRGRRRPAAGARAAHRGRVGGPRRRARLGVGAGAVARARYGSGSPAPTTGRRSRTRGGCATRWARRCRSASPRRSPSR